MKIRKGTEVRVRRTNQIATVSEVELIRKGGKLHKYCHLRTAGKEPDLWLDSEELAEVHEVCEVTFANLTGGQTLRFSLDLNHKTDELKTRLRVERPENLKEHEGLHMELAVMLLQKVCEHTENL